MRNFLSTGNIMQSIDLTNAGLTLVLGNNIDLGSDGSRNGVGKTCLINAISYALFGSALSNIKKNNLINKTNGKGMFCSIQFEINNTKYQIDRGRSPNIFRFIVDDMETKTEESDEGQGENRLTQQEVERVLGMNHMIFKHIIALNTYNEPFLSLAAAPQRQMIEHLLGITMLSEKAILLKELIRTTKDDIKEEEYRIKGIEGANEQIKKSITDLKRRQKTWSSQTADKIVDLNSKIAALNEFDIVAELENHVLLESYNDFTRNADKLQSAISVLTRNILKEETKKKKAEADLEIVTKNTCYACGNDLHADQHDAIMGTKSAAVISADAQIKSDRNELAESNTALSALGPDLPKPITVYSSAQDAYEKQNQISILESTLATLISAADPYTDQIVNLETSGVQEVSWESINAFHSLKDHQEFLLKLLTNKDSFIRKRIIQQNLSYLNSRLEYYLDKMGLSHDVVFQSDLTVEITELGRSLDFDNLSRGERNRLILGLSWAFRDVHESMNQPVDFMAIDELLDSGLDTNGMEAALGILKKLDRERNKNIFLISHREELVSRVSNILMVVKENGFTGFSTDMEEE